MGLFKSRIETIVSTSVNRVIEDKHLPNSTKIGLIRGVFTGESLTDSVLGELEGSIGVRAERMYRYGKDHYIHGLPTSKLHLNTTGLDIVKGVLEEQEGRPVTISYYHYGPLNNLHYGWLTLVNAYGYNPYTNELTVLSTAKGFPVYLDDFQSVVVEATVAELSNGALDQWGSPATAGFTPLRPIQTEGGMMTVPATPFGVDAAAAGDYFRVSCIWVGTETTTVDGVVATKNVIKKEQTTFPVSNDDPNKGYFQVKYSYGAYSDGGGEIGATERGITLEQYIGGENALPVAPPPLEDTHIKYWTYLDGSGTCPELDAIFSTEFDSLGSFFPFGYFRHEKHSLSEDPTSTSFKASKKLMEYLGMDFNKVGDAINANPDIADVDSALLMMVVPANSTNHIELRYLFDFFKDVYLKTGSAGIPKYRQGSNADNLLFKSTIYDLVMLSSTTHQPEISITIQDTVFKTVLNMDGIYRHTRVGNIGSVSKPAKVGDHVYGEDVEVITKRGRHYTDGQDTVGTPYSFDTTVPYQYYRRQITPLMYEEIQVWGLQLLYFIEDAYQTTTNPVMIPLDYSITKEYNMREREELYARSLHYIFNAKIETKLKWYQQEWFRVVLTIVAIVLTVLDWGSDGGGWLAAVAALGEMTLEQIIIQIVVFAAKYVAISVALKYLVKLVGPEFAAILAIAAALYAAYGTYTTVSSIPGLPWASEAMRLSSGLLKAVDTSLKDSIGEVYKESIAFLNESKEQLKLLKDANELLENDNLLTPFIIFGESPGTYYQRTCHLGNPGAITLDSVHTYVDSLLALPELPQTLGIPGHLGFTY